MKKYLAIILGAVFVLGFAASAFAIHAEIPAETQATVAKGTTQITLGGEIRMRGEIQQNTADFNNDKADGKAYYDGRIRLYLDAKVTPNVQGFIQLEAGNGIEGKSSDLWIWGNGNGSAFTTTPNNNASGAFAAGDSKRGALNVLEAWILYKGSGLLGIPAGLKVGHMPLALGNKLFFDHTKFGDDAIVLFADPTKELHVGLLTAKFREGNYNANATGGQNDDANGYVALFNYRAKDFGFSGDVTYVDDQTGAGAGLSGSPKTPVHAWNFALRGDANLSGLGVMGDIEMQSGKVDVANVKFRGWAAMAGLNYTLAPVKLILDTAYGSGDDKADNKFSAFVTSQSYVQHFTYIYDYRTVNACAQSSGGGLCNTWYIRAGAEADLAKDLSGLLNIYYLQAAKKEYGVAGFPGAVATTSKNIGTEVDAKLTYKIDRNLNYWVEGGYLFAGKFWESVPATSGLHDNAYAVRHGISLTF